MTMKRLANMPVFREGAKVKPGQSASFKPAVGKAIKQQAMVPKRGPGTSSSRGMARGRHRAVSRSSPSGYR